MMKIILDKKSLSLSLNKIKKLSKATSDFTPFLGELGNKMTQNVNENFDKEGAFLGERWARLSGNTIAQRIRAGYGAGPVLQRTGRLKKSTYEKEKNRKRIVVSNKAHYYKYHQLGTRKMPQRTIMQWNGKTKREAERMFRDYINKIIRNG